MIEGITVNQIDYHQQIQVKYKPQKTINSLFPPPKLQDKTDRPSSGIVYKISCRQCDFVYYGQTERSLKTRVSEHKKAVWMFDENSKVASHVHECHHQMDFDNVKVVGHEPNYHKRLFLEAWMSVKDTNDGNDHIVIPDVYKCLAPLLTSNSHAETFSVVTRIALAQCYF